MMQHVADWVAPFPVRGNYDNNNWFECVIFTTQRALTEKYFLNLVTSKEIPVEITIF